MPRSKGCHGGESRFRPVATGEWEMEKEASRERPMRVLIAAGGTGGHIFPATVFGRWIEAHRGASVSYLSGARPLEEEIYKAQGIVPHKLSLEGSPLGVRSPVRILRRFLGLLKSMGETVRCLARTRPEVCFLFGGYVSFPPLLLCKVKKIPVVIHEQNAVAGRVTRLASRMGASVASGWSECLGVRKPFSHVGIPVRPPGRVPRLDALHSLGLNCTAEGTWVGVIGGSLGSRSLVEKALLAAASFEKRGIDVKFLFLGEQPDGPLPQNVHFVGRRWDMNPFYSLCDVLACRAGGSTLAEAMAWGIPAVAVPWEGAAEGHQERNARCFAESGGGIVWRESGDGSLEDAIERLLSEGRRSSLKKPKDCVCPLLWSLIHPQRGAESGLGQIPLI